MKENTPKPAVGEMRKRREKMADGRRYLIYYTFENAENSVEKDATAPKKNNTEKTENV